MVTVKDKKDKSVFMMSIPIFVELFMQFLVGNIDQIMLSGISEDAVSCIVNANQVIVLTMLVMIFFSNAGMVRFTHAIGRGDEEMYSKTYFASHVWLALYAVVVMVIIMIFGKNILSLFNVDAMILDDAYWYLFVLCFGMIPQSIYFVNSVALRSRGMLSSVMWISIIMNIMNIVGNAILINGWFGAPALGVLGAGISTLASKVFGCLLVTWILVRRNFVKFEWKFFKNFPKHTTKRILHMAIPSSLESLSYNVSMIVVLGFINLFGNSVVATKGYCSIIANFSFLYSIAMAQATQIVVGYLIGRNEFDPVKKVVMQSSIICIVCSMTIMTVMYFASDFVFSLFSASPEIKALGKTVLLIEIFLEFGRAINIVMSRMLTSLGDTFFLMKMGISGHWLLGVLIAYVLGVHFDMGLVGIWIGMAIDECVRGAVYLIRFAMKKWDREAVLERQNQTLGSELSALHKKFTKWHNMAKRR